MQQRFVRHSLPKTILRNVQVPETSRGVAQEEYSYYFVPNFGCADNRVTQEGACPDLKQLCAVIEQSFCDRFRYLLVLLSGNA